MRTAKAIVKEYRQRGYDTFRIRAIAALRPEPMRGQILEILDAEEQACGTVEVTNEAASALAPPEESAPRAETAAGDAPAENGEEELDTTTATEAIPRESAPFEEDGHEEGASTGTGEEDGAEVAGDEADEENQEVSATLDEEEALALAAAQTEASDPEELEPPSAEVDDHELETSANERDEGAPPADTTDSPRLESDSVMDITDDMILDAKADPPEEDPFWDGESQVLAEEEHFEPVAPDETGQLPLAADQITANAGAAPEAPSAQPVAHSQTWYDECLEADELTPASKGEATALIETVAADAEAIREAALHGAAADAEDILATVQPSCEAPVEEATPRKCETQILTDAVLEDHQARVEGYERELASAPQSPTNPPMHVVHHADDEGPAAAEEDSNIISMTDVLGELNQAALFEMQAADDDSDSAWHDCGSGLILVPQSMHELQDAYNHGSVGRDEAAVEDGQPATPHDAEAMSIEELVDAIEREAARLEAVEQSALPAGEAPPRQTGPLDAQTVTAGSLELLSNRLQELECSLNFLEEALTTARRESAELSHLAQEKDEMLTLLNNQLVESQQELEQRASQLRELEGESRLIADAAAETDVLRAQLADLERERNILKTDTVPALEEQHLKLLDVLEDEHRAREQSETVLRRTRRRTTVGYSMAAAACLCALALPALNLLSGLPLTPAGIREAFQAQQNRLELVQTESARSLIDREEAVEQLQREKDALHASYRRREANWKKKEGQLQLALRRCEEQVAIRAADLREALAQKTQQFDEAQNQLALARTQIEQLSIKVAQLEQGGRRDRTVPATDRGLSPRPGREATTYVVKRGDTLSRIVHKRYGTSQPSLQKQVAKYNGLANPNRLHINQRLRLPAMAMLAED